jgi:hypothetical protein
MRTTRPAHLILLPLRTVTISVKVQPMMSRVTAARNVRTQQIVSLVAQVSLVLYSFSHHHCSDWWLYETESGHWAANQPENFCFKLRENGEMFQKMTWGRTQTNSLACSEGPVFRSQVQEGGRTQRHNSSCLCVRHGAWSPLRSARPHLYTTIITNDLSYNLLSKLSFSSQLKDRKPAEREHHKALHFVTNDTLLHKCYKLSQSTIPDFW